MILLFFHDLRQHRYPMNPIRVLTMIRNNTSIPMSRSIWTVASTIRMMNLETISMIKAVTTMYTVFFTSSSTTIMSGREEV